MVALQKIEGSALAAHGIEYRGVYKYQLLKAYVHPALIAIRPHQPVEHRYMALTTQGELTIKCGYAWDGASGPALDTPTIMRASLVHDALYQMMRECYLDQAARKPADKLLRDICLADGMSSIRAWWVYWGVRLFGKWAAAPRCRKANSPEQLVAPAHAHFPP